MVTAAMKLKKKICSLEESESESCSVMSDSLRPRGLYSPWNSLGQNTGVGSLSLLQRIKPSQASHITGDSLPVEPWEKPLEENMTNLDSVLKSRDITLRTKVHIVEAMVFPVVMYRCESWNIKKADHWKVMLLNCNLGEDSWEFLGLQEDQISQS